ncbi:hypothetical protein RNZ50_24845 [Paracoccaceae bacterium Fryx2]|nr:hypothetical protein [Paracoccaceae bacterium Fryx2]
MKKTDFDIHFENAFATMNQSKFEGWFASMACRVFGTDFELIKAGGSDGDKKSDGRRISTETVFQCYAPESPATFASKAKAKIADSFPEVVEYWPNLKDWVFIHNNIDGIPTSVSDKLEELREQYPVLKLVTATRNFLKDELHDKLTLQQLIDVYPSASLNFNAVHMEHIRPLLKGIIEARTVHPDPNNFGDIPDELKLDFNRLSPDSKHDIRRARPHLDVVDRFLVGMSNPQNASVIQAEMRAKYLELKDLGYDPDDILGKLLTFCGGGDNATVTAAAYVIVAYYLDACDVFENALGVTLC